MKITKKTEKKAEKNFDECTLDGVTMRVYESGFASLSIPICDGNIIVNGHIVEKSDGEHFFGFPAHKNKDGSYTNECYAIGDDLRKTIQNLVGSLID